MSESDATLAVAPSATLDAAVSRFLEAIGAWSHRVIQTHPEGIVSDSHDAGTFMTPWAVYVEASGDGTPHTFMRNYRDQAKRHFEDTGQWLDGYWRRQEVHHGTEHFDLFLRTLFRLDPDDPETVAQLEDVAEHIGNWKPGFPAWFDRHTGLFHSMYLGTEVVGEPSPNVPDHMRMVRLALLAYEMTGTSRYLELARRHGERWASAISGREALPVGVGAEGGVYDLGEDEKAYRSFAGAAPDDLSTNPPRAENLICSSVPDAMLELWDLTGDSRFRAACERIIDAATEELENPIAWQVHAAVRRYREATGSTRYDEQVRAISRESLRPIERLTLRPDPETRVVSGPIGMRADKPDWLDENGKPAPSPLLQALFGRVTGDEALFVAAVDLAFAHFRLGERVYGDVTHHGCGSRSLSAVCRGHGRLSGAGVVTEVLDPIVRASE